VINVFCCSYDAVCLTSCTYWVLAELNLSKCAPLLSVVLICRILALLCVVVAPMVESVPSSMLGAKATELGFSILASECAALLVSWDCRHISLSHIRH
jgi:hypothetical protein